MRRIFAGSLTAALLCVSSWAASCDLSCGFAFIQRDCHSQPTEAQDLAPNSMKMDGMPMTAMAMPDLGRGSGENQQAASGVSRRMVGHPSLAAMGPCERQSCDQIPAVSNQETHTNTPRIHLYVAGAQTSRNINGFQAVFRGSDHPIALLSFDDHSPLSFSLRI
jgi:hypothetical protein